MAFKGNLQTKKQSSPTLQGLIHDILLFTTAVDIIIPNKSLPKGERLVKRTGPVAHTGMLRFDPWLQPPFQLPANAHPGVQQHRFTEVGPCCLCRAVGDLPLAPG